jgi:hypothetical protein
MLTTAMAAHHRRVVHTLTRSRTEMVTAVNLMAVVLRVTKFAMDLAMGHVILLVAATIADMMLLATSHLNDDLLVMHCYHRWAKGSRCLPKNGFGCGMT